MEGGEVRGNELPILGKSQPGRAVLGSSKQSILRAPCLHEGKIAVEMKDTKEVQNV